MKGYSISWRQYCRLWKYDAVWAGLAHVALGLAGMVVWRTIVDQSKTYAFTEWVLKFVPYMLDSQPGDWFGAWEIGDPRARLVTIMATRFNVELRGRLSEWIVLPPAAGLNWVIYPLVIVCMYRFVRSLTGSRNVALGAAVLWAASPPALDTLVCCYVPAKALMNLWFVGAGWAGAVYLTRVAAGPKPSGLSFRVLGPLGVLAAITLAALLTDETAALIVLCLPIVLAGGLRRDLLGRGIAWLCAGFGVAGAGFAVIALGLYPWINRQLGQVPLRIVAAALQGPGVALIGNPGSSHLASSHFAGEQLSQNFQPLGLAYTMFSASLIPARKVVGIWTGSQPLLPSGWPLEEVAILWFAGVVAVSFIAILPARLSWLMFRLLVAAIVLIVIYAFLLVPLGPALLEIHYYGALFSMLFAIGGATLLLGPAPRGALAGLSVAGLAVVAALEFLGYEATARRTVEHFDTYFASDGHVVPSAVKRPWSSIRDLERGVQEGKFQEIALIHPYPSRDFYYAFELEAWRCHRRGERVDIYPLEDSHSLYGNLLDRQTNYLKESGYRDPGLIPPPSVHELTVKGARRLDDHALGELVRGKAWHGSNSRWTFTVKFDGAGRFIGRFWLNPLIRVWAQHGIAVPRAEGKLDLRGLSMGDYPIAQIYELGATYYAFDAKQGALFRFKLVPNLTWTE